MDLQECAASLRDIACFIEAHPELPLPSISIVYFPEGKAGMAAMARAFGECEKDMDDAFFRLTRRFGGLEIRAAEFRERVCERIKVGEKQVPGSYTPARWVEAHTEDVVEWKCPPLLEKGTEVGQAKE